MVNDHYPYKMAISLGIYPIFRQTHMVKHGETWWLWVCLKMAIHPTHFEYSIDLDRFGGALFSGKPNSICGLEPNCAQVYRDSSFIMSFQFFPHTMWILTHGEYYSQGKLNMFLLLYKYSINGMITHITMRVSSNCWGVIAPITRLCHTV